MGIGDESRVTLGRVHLDGAANSLCLYFHDAFLVAHYAVTLKVLQQPCSDDSYTQVPHSEAGVTGSAI